MHQCVGTFAAQGEQCGGLGWMGALNCTAGYECVAVDSSYSVCKAHSGPGPVGAYGVCGWLAGQQVWEAPCAAGSVCRRLNGERSVCLPAGLQHAAEDCWPHCRAAGDCMWCGAGNACCKRNSNDPPECSGINHFLTNGYECSVPVNPVLVKHQKQNCWGPCHSISGDCGWCGKGNSCCRSNGLYDAPECDSAINFTSSLHHECVATVSPVAVKHQGQNCLPHCGHQGGYCDWCGAGNACCQKGSPSDPAECEGATDFATTKFHTCVFVPSPVSLGRLL